MATSSKETPQHVINIDLDEENNSRAQQPDPITINIGGTTYTAHCPKDVVWAQFISIEGSRDVGEQARNLFAFIDSTFDHDAASELNRRCRDTDDPLSMIHLVRVIRAVMDHYRPVMEQQFEKLGLSMAEDDASE